MATVYVCSRRSVNVHSSRRHRRGEERSEASLVHALPRWHQKRQSQRAAVLSAIFIQRLGLYGLRLAPEHTKQAPSARDLITLGALNGEFKRILA